MEKGCIFCQIVSGETTTDLLFENANIVVFKDINPHAPLHLLIVPRKHIRSINDLSEDDSPLLSEMVMIAKVMARQFSVNKSGYRLFINVERGGGQVIFHLHMHLIGGWK